MASNKYYIFIDECGDQSLANINVYFPVFTLCGIVISSDNLKIMNSQIEELKTKYCGDIGVILHSREIRKQEKDFCFLNDESLRQGFYADLNNILSQKGLYNIVCCSILKEPYIAKFGKNNDVYSESLSYVLEKSLSLIDSQNAKTDDLQNNCRKKRNEGRQKTANVLRESASNSSF